MMFHCFSQGDQLAELWVYQTLGCTYGVAGYDRSCAVNSATSDMLGKLRATFSSDCYEFQRSDNIAHSLRQSAPHGITIPMHIVKKAQELIFQLNLDFAAASKPVQGCRAPRIYSNQLAILGDKWHHLSLSLKWKIFFSMTVCYSNYILHIGPNWFKIGQDEVIQTIISPNMLADESLMAKERQLRLWKVRQ